MVKVFHIHENKDQHATTMVPNDFEKDLINFVERVIRYQKSNFRIYNCGYGKHFSDQK